MSDARRSEPMRSGGRAQAGPETFLLFQIPGSLVVDRGGIWGDWCSGTPGPKCSQAYMLGPILKKCTKFWLCCAAGGILFPQPGTASVPLQGKHRAPTTGPPGKSYDPHFNIPSCMFCTWGKHPSPLCIGSLKGSLQGHRYGNKIATWDKCPAPSTSVQFSSVQSLTGVLFFMTPWTVARQASLSIANSQSLHKLMSIESVMPQTS